MKLILVRHGETAYNRADLFRGRADLELNEKGIKQARAAAASLSGTDFEAFYSSPLRRSVETAREIALPHGGEVVPIDYFVDVDYGEWSGRKLEEVRAAWPEEFALWAADPERVVFPGGESMAEVRKRLETGLEVLCQRHPGTVLLVGHKVVNRLVLCIVLGLPTAGIWRVDQSNGAVNIMTRDGGDWMLVRMNDINHLTGITSMDQRT